MNNNKCKLLHAVLLFCMTLFGYGTVLADGIAYLTVTKYGQDVKYEVSDIQKITFDAENMFLSLTNGETQKLPFAVFSKITIDGGTVGMMQTAFEKADVVMQDGHLKVNLENEGTIFLYDATGRGVKTFHAKAGSNSFDLGKLPTGVYLVRVNGNSQKIMNK